MFGRFKTSSTPSTPSTPLASVPNPYPNTHSFTSTPIIPFISPTPPVTGTSSQNSKKRTRQCDKENTPLTDKSDEKRRYTPRTSDRKKAEVVFAALKSVGWTMSDFLYFTFRTDIPRTDQHAKYAQHFLQGNCRYPVGLVLDLWLRSPDARACGKDLMYSTTTPYVEIGPARAALLSFAAQTVQGELVREAKEAVKPLSGLHATARRKGSQAVDWSDIGSATVSEVAKIIQKHQPLTWKYMLSIAQPQQRNTKGDVASDDQRRPPSIVCTHVISALNFTRNNEARLLPLARGLLYFAVSAPVDLFAYNSRIGEMPAYSTVYRALGGLSAHEAKLILEYMSNPDNAGALQIDNVQNYLRCLDPRIGLDNVMNIGIAATLVQISDIKPGALSLSNKRLLIAENKRANLTIEQVVGMIKQDHIETVLVLQWLRSLTHYMPAFSKWKEHVSILYRTCAAQLPLPTNATKVHPLATSGKNETVTTELKDAMVDFLGQLGQKPENYHQQLFLTGGDGLTYEKLIQLKRYLQFHNDPFKSFEIVEPVLSAWHTEWTDLSRIYETHWDSLLSMDPSTLGHSAAVAGKAAPPNLKKVDYHKFAEFMYLVLDVRMLDCWRIHFNCEDIFQHVEGLAASNKLPEFEDLEAAALKLHRTFSSTRAHYRALQDVAGTSNWSKSVPLGKDWYPPPVDKTSLTVSVSPPAKDKATNMTKDPAAKEPFRGDRILANSIAFMRDAMISREMSYATAEGDVGRVYEVMKVMLFTFAGSSHSKYTNYLLETVCNLELESSVELREAILRSMLVNLTGRAGAFSAADIMQEFFNRLLEAIVDKKGVEYGANFI